MASKQDTASYNGESFLLLDALPEDLVCPICHELLDDPVQTPCGHLFCNKCLSQAQTYAKQVMSPPIQKKSRRGKKKSTSCPLCQTAFSGDPYRDKYNERRVNSVKVKCPNFPCKWMGTLIACKQHRLDDKGCSYEVVSCPKRCLETMYRLHVKSHLKSTCIYSKRLCKYCRQFVLTSQLDQHYRACEHVPVCCPNKCGERTIPQHTVEDHLSVCPEQCVQCPYQSLGCKVVIVRKDMHIHKEEAKDSHLEFALQKVIKLSDTVSELSLSLASISQQGVKSEEEAPVVGVSMPHPSLCTESSERVWLRNKLYFPSLPWIVRMDNFNGKEKWYSKPFYTSLTGYKFCLLICLNNSNGDSQYLSVYTVLMSGPNDHFLSFPYKETLNVVLLNQLEDSYHCKCVLQYSKAPEECRRRVREGERTFGWGDTKFKLVQRLEKSELQNYQYLKDKSLYFRIEH